MAVLGKPLSQTILGTGLAFPFQFSGTSLSSNRGVAEESDIELVKESMRQILGSKVGRRIMRRSFGAQLADLVFAPIQPEFELLAEHIVRESLGNWEPRIIVGPISFDLTNAKEGRVDIDITFQVIKTQVVNNLVYPYFIQSSQTTPSEG